MEVRVYNQKGEEAGNVELPKVFDIPINHDLLTQVVSAQTANMRVPVANTKGRGEVRGGGKKPWRQKGTGRARHGSIRSPIWKGGGVTHGPTGERNFSKKINKKMASLALAMAVVGKARDGELVVMHSLALGGKTKEAAGMISEMGKRKELEQMKQKSKIFVLPELQTKEARALRNMRGVHLGAPHAVTARDILQRAILVTTPDALTAIGDRIAKSLKKGT